MTIKLYEFIVVSRFIVYPINKQFDEADGKATLLSRSNWLVANQILV